MPLTEDQARSLLTKAKTKKPDLTASEAKSLLAEANKRILLQPTQAPSGLEKAKQLGGDIFKQMIGGTVGNVGLIATAPVLAASTAIARGQTESTKKGGKAGKSFIEANKLTDQAKKLRAEGKIEEAKQLATQAREIMRASEKGAETLRGLTDFTQKAGFVSPEELQMGRAEFATRRGIKQSGELFSLLAPGTKELKAVGAVSQGVKGLGAATERIGAKGVIGAIQGLGVGTARASEGQTPEEVAQELVGGTASGLAGGLAFGAIGEVGKAGKEAFKNLAQGTRDNVAKVYTDTLKNNIKDEKFYQQYGGQDKVFKDSIKYSVKNTKDGVEKQLSEYGPKYNQIIEQEAKKAAENGSKVNISQAYKRAEERINKQFGHDKTLLKSAKAWFAENKSYLRKTNALPKTANELRKSFDKKVGEILTSEAAPADAARKAFATELRQEFKKVISQEGKDAIQKYQLLSGLAGAMKKEPAVGITELAYAGLSPGTGAFNLLELIAGKAARSPGLRRSAAQTLYQAAGTQIPSNIRQVGLQAKPAVEASFVPGLSALQRMIDKEKQAKQAKPMLK